MSGEPVLSKSKLIYNEKEYPLDVSLEISLASFPVINLQLYDDYGNTINNLSNITEKEFKLYVENNELSQNLILNSYLRLFINDSKVDQYSKIDKSNNNNYLYVKIGKETKIINITFIDEAQEEVKSDMPASFVISPDSLLLKAGEDGLISLNVYTEKGKPMNRFFKNSELHVSCSDNSIQIKTFKGKHYGSYDIILSSIKATDDQIVCEVNVADNSRVVNIKVIPDKVSKCQTVNNIPKTKSGDIYKLTFECFDKYKNKAHLENDVFGARVTNKNEETLDYKIYLNEDYSFDINIDTIYLFR